MKFRDLLLALVLCGTVLSQDKAPAGPEVKCEKMTQAQKEKIEKLIKEGDDLKKAGKIKEAEEKYNEAIDEADKGMTVEDNPKVKEGGKQKKAKAKYKYKDKDPRCGYTTSDGDVYILDAGLHFRGKPSAGWLRSTKGHEYTHYSQICNRWGDNGNLNQLEAMNWEIENADKNLLTKAEKEANEAAAKYYRDKLSDDEKKKADKGDYSQPCTIGKGVTEMDKVLYNLQYDEVCIVGDQFVDSVFVMPAGSATSLVFPISGLIGVPLLATSAIGKGGESDPRISTPPTTPKIGTQNSEFTAYYLSEANLDANVSAKLTDGSTVKGERLTRQGDYVFKNNGKPIEMIKIENPGQSPKEVKTQYAVVKVQYPPAAKTGQELKGIGEYEVSEAMVGKRLTVIVTESTGKVNPMVEKYDILVTAKRGTFELGGKQIYTGTGQATIGTSFTLGK